MRKKLLVALLSVGTISAFAQPYARHIPGGHPSPFGRQPQPANTAAARTSSGSLSRCIAEVNYYTSSGAFVIADSATYGYIGTHGAGYPQGWPWKYDNGLQYSYNLGTGTYSNSQKYTQTFDGSDNITTSLTQVWDSAAASWNNSFQVIFTYDGLNNNITQVGQYWNGTTSAWVNSYRDSYTYSGTTTLTDTAEVWNTATSSWGNDAIEVYSYNALNQKDTFLQLEWDGGSSTFYKSYRAMYTYDGSGNLTNELDQESSFGSSTWTNNTNELYSSYVAPQCYQQQITQMWDIPSSSFVNDFEYINTYNSYNQLTYQYTQSWDTVGTGSWYTGTGSANRLYYELNTTGVQNTANTGGKAVIYPVPAKNTLSIDITWDVPQPFTLAIYDMQGHLVLCSQVPAMAAYKDNIPVSNLAPGNYIIKAQGNHGAVTSEVTIEK